ncbi:hypothetical protein CCACVL1_07159 [Corchorus capsularis]|uniref:Uncharacterized protein n=1 Tax=Corchorus capsularis TaxID=210143 RepID=A0A1R3J919_COCAP|nr:hypothetical protein CCACVL1_07159 [Corchorus capsularis]
MADARARSMQHLTAVSDSVDARRDPILASSNQLA